MPMPLIKYNPDISGISLSLSHGAVPVRVGWVKHVPSSILPRLGVLDFALPELSLNYANASFKRWLEGKYFA